MRSRVLSYSYTPPFTLHTAHMSLDRAAVPLCNLANIYNVGGVRCQICPCMYVTNYSAVAISANPKMETQPEALILGNNMSSGVTVPIFGKKFAKME